MPLLRRLASAAVLSLLGILSFAQNTVILDDSLVVTVSSSLKMKVEETVRIMVLNKDGEDDAAFMKTLASGWSLKSFSGRLVDPMGKVVAKYGPPSSAKDWRTTTRRSTCSFHPTGFLMSWNIPTKKTVLKDSWFRRLSLLYAFMSRK